MDSLQNAIEESVSLQPYVEAIRVRISKKLVKEKINKFGYCELEGKMLNVELTVKYGRAIARVGLEYDGSIDYPLMRIIAVKELKIE